jgi:hypothetical protein
VTFAVIATGESVTPEQVERVRKLTVIVVSDAYRLAPWAEVLVSGDRAWWRYHMPEFAGRRFSHGAAEDTEKLPYFVASGTNSGVLAIKVARHLGAKRIILLGFDGKGGHFFGPHPTEKRGTFSLSNTTDGRRKQHVEQHIREADECKRAGVEVWNCSPGTVLGYPVARLEDVC